MEMTIPKSMVKEKLKILAKRIFAYQPGQVLPEIQFFDPDGEVKIVLFPYPEYKENEHMYYSLAVIVNRAFCSPDDEDVFQQWTTDPMTEDELLSYMGSDEGLREVAKNMDELCASAKRENRL